MGSNVIGCGCWQVLGDGLAPGISLSHYEARKKIEEKMEIHYSNKKKGKIHFTLLWFNDFSYNLPIVSKVIYITPL